MSDSQELLFWGCVVKHVFRFQFTTACQITPLSSVVAKHAEPKATIMNDRELIFRSFY